jgi:hypothetical protein
MTVPTEMSDTTIPRPLPSALGTEHGLELAPKDRVLAFLRIGQRELIVLVIGHDPLECGPVVFVRVVIIGSSTVLC